MSTLYVMLFEKILHFGGPISIRKLHSMAAAFFSFSSLRRALIVKILNQTFTLRTSSNYAYLPQDEWEIIESKISKLEFNKGELILETGTVCRHLYFLESGFLRYFVLRNGMEITKYFTEAPYAFTSKKALLNTNQRPKILKQLRTALFGLSPIKTHMNY